MARPTDRHELDRLVVEQLPSLLRFARRLTRDPDSAEDVVQEALRRVLAGWRSYRGESAIGSWLTSVVLNVYRDRLRKESRQSPDLAVETLADSSAGPEQLTAADETRRRIRQAIDALPDRQREIALLFFAEGFTAPQIAETIPTTTANVYTTLHHARKKIAAAIGRPEAAPRT